MDFTIDSGSATSCVPVNILPQHCVIKEAPSGPASYTSASGNKVSVVGQIRPECPFQNGVTGFVELSVLEPLEKALISTSRLCKKGYRVIHDFDSSYIEDKKTGAQFRIYERNGVYVLPAWIRSPNTARRHDTGAANTEGEPCFPQGHARGR